MLPNLSFVVIRPGVHNFPAVQRGRTVFLQFPEYILAKSVDDLAVLTDVLSRQTDLLQTLSELLIK